MFEKRFAEVPAQPLTTNGSTTGIITVQDTSLFKVKQEVILRATSLPTLDLEVKQVYNTTQMRIGPRNRPISEKTDVSAYTTILASEILANEQSRPKIPFEEHTRAVYEEEPTVAVRSVLVDKLGNKIDNVVDNNGINRLAVDGQFHAEVDVQVDVDIDGTYDSITNLDPDNIGIIGHERSITTGQPQQTQPITAIRGTLDTDTVSQDISLHDNLGNAYTPLNPLPVVGSYEKFFSLIAASRWMKLANYDEVIPSIVGSTLTLIYKEDGAFLGEAVISNYYSSIGWSLKLNRYVDDDDGTIILDDNGSPLNLD